MAPFVMTCVIQSVHDYTDKALHHETSRTATNRSHLLSVTYQQVARGHQMTSLTCSILSCNINPIWFVRVT